MMSRSRIFPSFSSSRQMMIAWNVSGLSHSPAIIASRPASMRLAIAISPSRESSSTEPISRRYIPPSSPPAPIHPRRIVGALARFRLLGGLGDGLLRHLDEVAAGVIVVVVLLA